MPQTGLTINDQDYFEMPGLNVLVYHNLFPEGHQSGIEIIQHGERVATNGELRLSPSPGQWQPVPEVGGGFEHVGVSPQTVELKNRKVDRAGNEISVSCCYPDKDRERKGFNPLVYPDLRLEYAVRVRAEGESFTVAVDLAEPLPEDWVGRVGYSLELFPGNLYGKTYYMDGRPGAFPRQAGGPTYQNPEGEAEAVPFAEGRLLVVAPESDEFRMAIECLDGRLQLLDGSLKHNNGWFVVHSLLAAGAAAGAVRWKISPHVIPGWKYTPVIHLSQAGYHPVQSKAAYIELDRDETELGEAELRIIDPQGGRRTVMKKPPALWGRYLRYQYATFDFTEVREPGVYELAYGGRASNPILVDRGIFKRHVWQPTLEYFLPMQMCHMRVNQKYRVWHGLCHMDDALMAPPDIDHFDGYGNSGEKAGAAPFRPLERISGMDSGGWHDAGDDDIRTDTQINTVVALALTYEEFGVDYDETLIDPQERLVEIHQPDGKPDILQQIEHGVVWILNTYRRLGRLGLGVIVPTLRQYVHQGDPSTQTDNRTADPKLVDSRAARLTGLWYTKVANRYSKLFDPQERLSDIEEVEPDLDDRLMFLQHNPVRQLSGAAGLALAARVLKGYDGPLAAECLKASEELWAANKHYPDEVPGMAYAYGHRGSVGSLKIHALAELFLTTGKDEYRGELCAMGDAVRKHFGSSGWALGRVLPKLECPEFQEQVFAAASAYRGQLEARMAESPFGSPLAHTEIVGMKHYFLHKGWPDLFSIEPMFHVLTYLLGCRPGKTTNSLVSGVGLNSPTTAYGFNRADWSYIPGGTFWNAVNLVRPDLPEDKHWPFLWQEREYITDAACMFMFMVLAADRMLEAAENG
ncbi:MAG: glycoside hydrolase family 9 protein [Anaerolineales bacterium]|nr:glycoside hydrolase family 9 protein [Anaerolineales bacterium]